MALANVAAPLLLIVSVYAFATGFIFIVLIEWFLLHRLCRLSSRDAAIDSLLVNFVSSLLAAVVYPLLVGVGFPLTGYMFSPEHAPLWEALGTLVGAGVKRPELAGTMTAVWFFVGYLLTIWVESKLLHMRWDARKFQPTMSHLKISALLNTCSYAILVTVFFSVLHLNDGKL